MLAPDTDSDSFITEKQMEFIMSKILARGVLTASLLAVSTSCLIAQQAQPASATVTNSISNVPPNEKALIPTVLPWVGTAPADVPKTLLLQNGNQVVAIGDSITAGGGYLRATDAALAELYPALKFPKIINAGVSGQKAEQLIARFQKDVIDRKPAAVTISIGINDVWHRMKAPHDENILKAYKENVAKMVDMAQANGIMVILLTPTLIQENPDGEANQRLVQYVDAMKAVALEKKCGLADLHALFLEALKHKPADIRGNWLTKDGVHMSPLGNAIMATGVLRALGVPDAELAKLK